MLHRGRSPQSKRSNLGRTASMDVLSVVSLLANIAPHTCHAVLSMCCSLVLQQLLSMMKFGCTSGCLGLLHGSLRTLCYSLKLEHISQTLCMLPKQDRLERFSFYLLCSLACCCTVCSISQHFTCRCRASEHASYASRPKQQAESHGAVCEPAAVWSPPSC